MPKSIKNFTKEREELLQKMLAILGVNQDNKMFSLKKLDEDQQKQKQIIDLVEDIKKYFICSRWAYFSNQTKEFKRDYLSLIKSVLRDMQVKIFSSFLHIKTDDKIQYETFYVLDFSKITLV
jgi:hypothetical protein